MKSVGLLHGHHATARCWRTTAWKLSVNTGHALGSRTSCFGAREEHAKSAWYSRVGTNAVKVESIDAAACMIEEAAGALLWCCKQQRIDAATSAAEGRV